MSDIKQNYALAGELIREVAWEIWLVKNEEGKSFTVSGEVAAREWVAREGGYCCFTGRYEAPSIG